MVDILAISLVNEPALLQLITGSIALFALLYFPWRLLVSLDVLGVVTA